MSSRDKRFILLQIAVAFFALLIGIQLGPLQALDHSELNLYPALSFLFTNYYQGLTLHGVLNALIFTTLFITGFHTFAILKGTKFDLRWYKVAVVGYVLMVAGLIVTAVMIFTNQASVLYTFYPPLKASPWFYIGLTVFVIGSWMIGWSDLATIAAWKKAHPGERTPIIAMGAGVNVLLWQLATLGIAVEMLVLVIPWALNIVPTTDALLSRVLFWFTGHPLVYFWLLPAYVSWYGMLPKQVGGKLFSDSLARLAFWLFLVLSTPVGFHHQFADPGVPIVWKYIHTSLTFLVVIPSFMTAFTLLATLERAGRKAGGKGLFGWIKKLPWGDPSVAGQLLAGVLFFFGGTGGIINASAQLNLVIHNTTWIPGHFHLTVANASTLTFMALCFWLIPYLTGRKTRFAKLGKWSIWVWSAGMFIFSFAMHWLGLLGAPRRVPLSIAVYGNPTWDVSQILTGVGGVILYIGGMMFFVWLIASVFNKEKLDEPIETPAAESEIPSEKTPAWLDNWTLWITIAVILVIIGYGPVLIDLFSNINLTSPGFKVW